MQINTTQHFAASPDAVKAMYLDPEFWNTIVARGKGCNANISINGNDAEISFDLEFPASVPSIVTKVIGKTGKIFQNYTWADSPTQTHKAVVSIGLAGVPAQFDGNISFAPDATGTAASIAGEFAVKVPLIGKKLESEAGPIIVEAFDLQAAVGSDYLAERS